MDPIAIPLPLPQARPAGRHLMAAWPLIGLFLLLPVWWGLGVSGFVLPAFVLPMLAGVALRRRISVPRGFGLYLLFLLWCVFSAGQVDEARQLGSLAYRGALYVGAGLLFLWVLNADPARLPSRTVVHILLGFFAIAVVGGILGMLIPNTSFATPAQVLLPGQLMKDQFVADLVSASTSSGRAFSAYPVYRPKAPFIYSNEWGAAYAMALPFALCALSFARTRANRDLLLLLVAVSVFPLVFSLNRGAWLSAGAGVLYAMLRMSRGRNAQLFKTIAVGGLVLGALMFVSPLGEIVMARLNNGYGDAHRQLLYAQSLELVRASPVLGYGAPVLVEGNLSAGTHGQLWTVLVSQGIPGLLFFAGWLVLALAQAIKKLPEGHPGDRSVRLWAEVAIFVAIVQMPYYDLLPWGLAIAMIAAGLAFRERLAPARRISPN
jgi:O-antigen ligase